MYIIHKIGAIPLPPLCACSACYWTAYQRTSQSTQKSLNYTNHQEKLRNIKLSYLQNINKIIKQLITSNEGTSNTESCTVPSSTPKTSWCGCLRRHTSVRRRQPATQQWTLPSQPLVTNARPWSRMPYVSLFYSLPSGLILTKEWCSVSKTFLKLHRFSAKVLRFKEGLLSMEVTYSMLQ